MDVLRELGPAFLGSRLKRLSERLQSGAARIAADAGLKAQPSHMPILAALEGAPLTIGQLVQAIGISQPGITRSVGQLVELGLVKSRNGADQRQRTISMTKEGERVLAQAKLDVWPKAEAAVRALLGEDLGRFMEIVGKMETALAVAPLDAWSERVGSALKIREYTDDLAVHFRDINAEWINAMFRMEPTDQDVLDHPRERIIDAGGTILFVEALGLGIVGAGALMPAKDGGLELTKMGVRESARGLKAGEHLLAALIARAQRMDGDPFFLLTNTRCAAAIHLYEKNGFRHDAGIMARYGARYERCDVAMRYRPA
jgi:DNA-binding MarR family transcriptional regulator/N-acetylglutamate synthase-like GNAT family acetyltransferase